jgi:hypothetical protein
MDAYLESLFQSFDLLIFFPQCLLQLLQLLRARFKLIALLVESVNGLDVVDLKGLVIEISVALQYLHAWLTFTVVRVHILGAVVDSSPGTHVEADRGGDGKGQCCVNH